MLELQPYHDLRSRRIFTMPCRREIEPKFIGEHRVLSLRETERLSIEEMRKLIESAQKTREEL
jgi:hypothetical protein